MCILFGCLSNSHLKKMTKEVALIYLSISLSIYINPSIPIYMYVKIMKIKVEIMRKKHQNYKIESQNYEMMSTLHHWNLSFHLIFLFLTGRNVFPYRSISCKAYDHSLLTVRYTIEHL